MTSRAGNLLSSLLLNISACAMALFIALFLIFNRPALTHFGVLVGLGALYGALYVYLCCHLALYIWRGAFGGRASTPARLFLLSVSLVLVYLFLANTVLDYYQPLTLYDEAIAALAVAWGSLVLVLWMTVLRALTHKLMWRLCLLALLGVPLMGLLERISEPQPAAGLLDHRDLFVGGEGDYAIYRIPALVVLPAGQVLANGHRLENDRVLAFAEARRDAALDTGVIDLVQKTSDDGGETWSAQKVVCRHELNGQRGKCGNATPVFDARDGVVVLAYNLSGLEESGHRSLVARSEDGGQNWSAGVEVASDNFVFGPGHGIQKQHPPALGRLLIPGYTDAAAVMFSDDGGQSWQRSAALDTGNETAIAELSDGRLYLNTRHRAPIGRPPQPNGRLYAHSEDGGASWSQTRLDETLTTPVCQVSLQVGNGLLIFSNPAHPKARARMTVRYSPDDGDSWPVASLVYPGPAGYSELGVLDSGEILLLYERGGMSYSEKISLARLPAPDPRIFDPKR